MLESSTTIAVWASDNKGEAVQRLYDYVQWLYNCEDHGHALNFQECSKNRNGDGLAMEAHRRWCWADVAVMVEKTVHCGNQGNGNQGIADSNNDADNEGERIKKGKNMKNVIFSYEE